MYFKNRKQLLIALKGDAGAKIVSTELIGQDENGGNIYEQTFDDGSKTTFTAPKGEKGEQGLKGDTGEKGEKGDAGAQWTRINMEMLGDLDDDGNWTNVKWTGSIVDNGYRIMVIDVIGGQSFDCPVVVAIPKNYGLITYATTTINFEITNDGTIHIESDSQDGSEYGDATVNVYVL